MGKRGEIKLSGAELHIDMEAGILAEEAVAQFERAWAEIEERMNQPYSHRNGEKEPPTEGGWYWATMVRSRAYLVPGMPLIFVATKRYGKVLFAVELDEPVADIQARWWGPVVPPWKNNV